MINLIPKKYILYSSIILIFVALFYSYINSTKKYDRNIANLKAELADKDSTLNNNKYVHQIHIKELQYINDSLTKSLLNSTKKLGIKEKNLKGLQFISSSIYKVDTIVFRDTIFKDAVSVDTVIKDDWHSSRIEIKYPSTIVLTPSFKSEKHIIVSYKKETVNKPSKFWLFRLFQRKHKVIKVDVIEHSPYVVTDTTKFIEIIK